MAYEVAFIQYLLKHFEIQGAKVLDFGCGNGALVSQLRESGIEAFGFDVSTSLHLPEDMPSYICISKSNTGDYQIDYPDDFFDLIVSFSVIEHIDDKRNVFRELARVMMRQGHCFHAYPSKYFLPFEPHLRVPLINFFEGHNCRRLLTLYGALGILRFAYPLPGINNPKATDYYDFYRKRVFYVSNCDLIKTLSEFHLDVTFNQKMALEALPSRSNGVARWLPFGLGEWVTRNLRYSFIHCSGNKPRMSVTDH